MNAAPRGLLAASLLVSMAATGVLVTREGSPPRPLPPARAAAAGESLATTSVTPAYLPDGARLVERAAHDRFPGVREHQYQLAGPANADTIPPEGVTGENARTVHPANLLEVTFVPDRLTLPEVIADPVFYDIRPVTVAGLPALLSTPKDGFGVVRVDWVDGAGYHVVLCERLNHVEGIAGVEEAELLHVAESLYA